MEFSEFSALFIFCSCFVRFIRADSFMVTNHWGTRRARVLFGPGTLCADGGALVMVGTADSQ
jgi:hypothetical protein